MASDSGVGQAASPAICDSDQPGLCALTGMQLRLVVFLLPTVIAMIFAFVTDHRWEDWYITYRASKNLAIGNGLVFNPGERVHSFTSPIGTVLPAIIRVATLNRSDETVIWIFRILSSLTLGAAALYLLALLQKLKASPFTAAFLIGIFSTSILIIDFSINGMETAFMMLFLSCLIYVVVARPARMRLQLAAALAGLMYTRPDGFIYGGSILLGFVVFHNQAESGLTRGRLLWLYCQGALLGALIYSPWLVATTLYYGSPVPHSISAKGALSDHSASGLWLRMSSFPVRLLSDPLPLFTPPYSNVFGSWTKTFWKLGEFKFNFLVVGHVLTVAVSIVWLCPGVKLGGTLRALSLAVLLQLAYLMALSGATAAPWYLPNILLPALVVLALSLDYVLKRFAKQGWVLWFFKGLAGLILSFNFLILILGGYQLKTQQEVIEFGNRKAIGEWLKVHATKGETVFLECLGYIPFFSELKPYDFPGMSSPEMVAARKKFKSNNYALLVNELQPDWLVLRPFEAAEMERDNPQLMRDRYELMQAFDVRNKVPDSEFLYGKDYLYFDSHFLVYKKHSH